MLDGYGIHTLIRDSADERLGDFLVASPADAEGRGLELHVRQGGAAANLTGANVYFLWRHHCSGKRKRHHGVHHHLAACAFSINVSDNPRRSYEIKRVDVDYFEEM